MSANMCQISKMTYNHFNMFKHKKWKKKSIFYYTTSLSKTKNSFIIDKVHKTYFYHKPFKIAHHYIHQRQETSQ